MRHLKRKLRLTKSQSQRKAIIMNLAKAIFTNKRIETTYGKAKAAQPFVERVISYAKRGGLHAYRLVESEIHDQRLVKQIVEKIATQYKDRNGGYTRILKLGPRRGDNAPMVLFELVGDFKLKDEPKKVEVEEKKESTPRKKKVVKKVVVDKKGEEKKEAKK